MYTMDELVCSHVRMQKYIDRTRVKIARGVPLIGYEYHFQFKLNEVEKDLHESIENLGGSLEDFLADPRNRALQGMPDLDAEIEDLERELRALTEYK